MRSIFFLTSFLFLISTMSPSLAAGPGSGTETKHNVKIGLCNANSITVKWKLDSIMGEPTVLGSLKWQGDSNCTLPSSTTIWLEVTDDAGNQGYVRVAPVMPKANADYGYNTKGSPNWNKLLCGYQGPKATNCLSKSSAKPLWKTGNVTDFRIETGKISQSSSRQKQSKGSNSVLGRWRILGSGTKHPGVLTLKSDGKANYHINNSNYPARWKILGSKITAIIYGDQKDFDNRDSTMTMIMNKRGNRVTGRITYNAKGYQPNTLEGKKL